MNLGKFLGKYLVSITGTYGSILIKDGNTVLIYI